MKKYSNIILESSTDKSLVTYLNDKFHEFKTRFFFNSKKTDLAFFGCNGKFNSDDLKHFNKDLVKTIISKLTDESEEEIIKFFNEYSTYSKYSYLGHVTFCDKFMMKILEVLFKRDLFNAFKVISKNIILMNGYSISIGGNYYNAQKIIFNTLASFKDKIDVNKYLNFMRNKYKFVPNSSYMKKLVNIADFRNTEMYKILINKYRFSDITTDRARLNGTLVLINLNEDIFSFYVHGTVRKQSNTSVKSVDFLHTELELRTIENAEQILNMFMIKYSNITRFLFVNKKIIETAPQEIQNKLYSNVYAEACKALEKLYDYFYNDNNAVFFKLIKTVTLCDSKIVILTRTLM